MVKSPHTADAPASSTHPARRLPPAQRPPRSAWQGYIEPVIFAVVLVAAVLAMNAWFNEKTGAVTQPRAEHLKIAAAPR